MFVIVTESTMQIGGHATSVEDNNDNGTGEDDENETSHIVFCGCWESPDPTGDKNGTTFLAKVCWKWNEIKLFYKMNVHVQFLILRIWIWEFNSIRSYVLKSSSSTCTKYLFRYWFGSIILKNGNKKRKGISISFE